MAFLMTIPNWNELAWYHYLALGDVVVVLALLLYFATASRLKMPAILVGILGGMGVGGALGAGIVIGMIALGVQKDRDYVTSGDEPPTQGGGPPGMGKGGGPFGKKGFGKMGSGAGPKGMGGGGVGPSSKTQLAALVTKLDQLTHKPLAVTLDAEQKKKVHETLQKLGEEKEVSDEQAKAKLDELQKILTEDQRKTLETAGYRWPGQGGGGRGGQQTPPNPFSEGANSEHLKSLLAESK